MERSGRAHALTRSRALELDLSAELHHPVRRNPEELGSRPRIALQEDEDLFAPTRHVLLHPLRRRTSARAGSVLAIQHEQPLVSEVERRLVRTRLQSGLS